MHLQELAGRANASRPGLHHEHGHVWDRHWRCCLPNQPVRRYCLPTLSRSRPPGRWSPTYTAAGCGSESAQPCSTRPPGKYKIEGLGTLGLGVHKGERPEGARRGGERGRPATVRQLNILIREGGGATATVGSEARGQRPSARRRRPPREGPEGQAEDTTTS